MQSGKAILKDRSTNSVRESYDRVADEYTRRIFNELEHKPFDRELLNRFAAGVRDQGKYVIWVAVLATWPAISTRRA